jgi:hypothetical protein
MRSTRTRLIDLANASKGMVGALAFSTFLALTPSPVSAMVVAPSGLLQQQARQDSLAAEVRARAGGAARRTTVVGPRGGAASRTVVRGGAVARPGAVVRPGYAGGGVRWARPGRYYWPRGGAIAAGAAIGVVTAATAAAWAGAAPAPGMCWYYTDPSRTQGFWDYCQ